MFCAENIDSTTVYKKISKMNKSIKYMYLGHTRIEKKRAIVV